MQVQFNLRTPNVTEETRDKTQKTYAWEAVLMPSWTKKFGNEKPFVFLDVAYAGSVKLSKEEWTDDYKNSNSDAYKVLASKVEKSV